MSKKKRASHNNTTTSTPANTAPANLVPGFAILSLAVVATVAGFVAGAKVMPFGGIAIASCVFSAIQMIQRRSVVLGYASFFIAVPAIAVATFLPV